MGEHVSGACTRECLWAKLAKYNEVSVAVTAYIVHGQIGTDISQTISPDIILTCHSLRSHLL